MLFAHPYQCPSVKSLVHTYFVRVGVVRDSRRLETGINMFFNQISNLLGIQPIRIFSR